jgi:P27 family predicted phage terminase small subunit
MRGRKPKPTAIRKAEGNPGKRAFNPHEPLPPGGKPSCPPHLSTVAKTEWKRICGILYDMGVITQIDRAVLAGYCQAYARWVEAERKLKEGPTLIKTPSGYVQQSPWLGISHKNQELMGRYMAELGLTPASRSKIAIDTRDASREPLQVQIVRFVVDPAEDDAQRLIENPSGRDADDL